MGQLIEILILAFIAGMIIFKLISVLGQRTGFEQSQRRTDTPDEVGDHEKNKDFLNVSSEKDLIGPGLRKVYSQILSIDSRFSLNQFLTGATRAFEMIVMAYARSDLKTLKPLLSSEIYQDFQQAIKEREENKESLETTIVTIETPEITDLKLEGTEASITVRFTSEQIHLTRDEKGEIIEGDPKQSEQIIDLWTFSRDLYAKERNWTLIKTDQ
ncbi:MAG: hypothetical protein BGO77_03415 [Caedibacter sp. 37-49]|nr:MAG: hypothetical protein BGO77_03415 [Caedibacter sp. 37-49]